MNKIAAAVGILSFVAATAVNAAACTAPDGDDDRVGTSATSDVTLNGEDSTECQIFEGNSGQGGGTFLADFGLPAFSQLYNEDSNGGTNVSFGPINGITFSDFYIDFDAGNESGTFGFSWTGGPAAIDFVYSMHAGGTSGYYFFDDVLLTPESGEAGGTWEIQFVNNGGRTPAWSNGQFWARVGEGPTELLIPEPLSLSLIGIGLAALGLARRRRPS